MKVLVVGGGGREHAIVWRLSKDRARHQLFCAPGNAGTAELAVNLAAGAEDLPAILDWSRRERPDLVVVGPEAPLCAGLADLLAAERIPVFGPSRDAARLEGSKAFCKSVMEQAGVPTARAARFERADEALRYVAAQPLPLVVKADGLAAGKGVTICQTREEAAGAVRAAMQDRVFGDAGASILVEEFLEGEEASLLALVDGRRIVPLASAQDHKRIFAGDTGPNTGGMGAYSPAPVVTDRLWPAIREQVFERMLAALGQRNIEYRGVLYAGLMIGPTGPKVLEFNCRFGDPETQCILPRMECEFAHVLLATATGRLDEDMIGWSAEACVCVVVAAGGYPGPYEKGHPIEGLAAAGRSGALVFHAGTATRDGQVVTAGGRVLGVCALGPDLRAAAERAYAAADAIRFEGMQFRRDIAHRALRR
jgi:phosphoribosylamine--glycine ligase